MDKVVEVFLEEVGEAASRRLLNRLIDVPGNQSFRETIVGITRAFEAAVWREAPEDGEC
jgi:L-amino acid N-acyltransferase YncA